MRINEDYLDDIENMQDVLQHDDSVVDNGKWWLIQIGKSKFTPSLSTFVERFQKRLRHFFQISNVKLHLRKAEPELFNGSMLPENGLAALSFDCNFRTFKETFHFFKFLCEGIEQTNSDFIIDYNPSGSDEYLYYINNIFAAYIVSDYWLDNFDVSTFISQDASKMLGFLYDTFDLFQRWLPDYDPSVLVQKLDDKLYIGDCITFCRINGFMQLTGNKPQMLRWPIETAELLSDQEVVPGSQFWRLHAGIKVLCGEGLRATSPKTHNKFVHSTINTHQVSMYWHEQLRTIMLGFLSHVVDGFPIYVYFEYKIQKDNTVEGFVDGLKSVFQHMKIDDMEEIYYELSHLIV